MVTLAVVLLGGVSLSHLPIDLLPDVTFPVLSVSTTYENASPEEIEELITRPIEEAMSAVPGAEEVSSVSTEGQSNVRVAFSWDADLDAAANDIRDRLDHAIARLPEDASRPSLHKRDLAGFPVMVLGASSGLDPIEMRRIIDEQVKYRIERVPGVASLDVWGGHEREMHVDLHADKIKALGIPLDLILARIKAENVEVPAGLVERGNFEVMVRTLGSYANLDQIASTVVAVREGVPVRLGEIAEVKDSWRRVTRVVRVNGAPGVRLGCFKQSGTNTVAVARGVLREMVRINRDIPQINLMVMRDTSEYIQQAISNVGRAGVLGGVFAVLVLFFFLRDLRSTAVIALAIPISVIATFMLMYFAGLTLNIMTLGGLALGVGMLLDNSIVVLENVSRLRESGMTRVDAAVAGAEEVTAAVTASTLTTLAVFLPLVFLADSAGVMFRQLSYVVAFSLTCSLAVALTIVPMLSARIGRRSTASGAAQSSPSERGHVSGVRAQALYGRLLRSALDDRWTTVAAAVAVLAASLALVKYVGVELMPATDEGEVRIDGEMEIGTRLGVVDGKFGEIERIVRETVPEMNNVVASTGGSHWRGKASHTGRVSISLVPRGERSRSSEDVAADLRKRLSSIPGLVVRVRASGGMLGRMMSRMMSAGDDRISVEVRGHDLKTSAAIADHVKEIIENVPGITDARLSRESGSPEEVVVVDRDRAADMGLSVSQIAGALQTVLSGTTAGYFREAGKEYGIRVRLKEADTMVLDDILDLKLASADGTPVALKNVVKLRPRTGPIRIERKSQERIVTVSAEIEGRDMGSVVADIREALRTVPVPRDFQIVFGGDYEEQQKAFSSLLVSFVLALILVYMVMASLYESLRDPFVVMFTVPFAAIGVVLMLFLTKTTFNVQSFIGCIMLGGIVVNNAILIVDHTNLLRRRDGMLLAEAVEEAGRRRLRPILMTALTTMLALVPLALGLGEGGEAQAPMARAVIGGLLSSTLITLVLVPVVYSVFEKRVGRGAEASGRLGQGTEAEE
jgi:HAE1 family hydrophobic/amphiphilic exporter-1